MCSQDRPPKPHTHEESKALSFPNKCVDPTRDVKCLLCARGLSKNEGPPEWAETMGITEPMFASGSWQAAGQIGPDETSGTSR